METLTMKKALILRDVQFRFGKRLIKGEVVNIKKDTTTPEPTFVAFRPGNEVLGYWIKQKFFRLTDERKLFVVAYNLDCDGHNKGHITKHKTEIEAINYAIEANAASDGLIHGTANEVEAIQYCKEYNKDFFALFG